MTMDEIVNMVEGRELDALIAEKVMGWFDYYPHFSTEHHFSGWFAEVPKDKLGICMADEDWSPSTDIAAAWEVVEKVDADLDARCVDVWRDANHWNFSIHYDKRVSIASADTAPLAICRAALLAVLGV